MRRTRTPAYFDGTKRSLSAQFVEEAVELAKPNLFSETSGNFYRDCVSFLVLPGVLRQEKEFLRRVKRQRELQEREESLLRFFKKAKTTHDPTKHSPLIRKTLREGRRQMALGILPDPNSPIVFPVTHADHFSELYLPHDETNESPIEYYLKRAYDMHEIRNFSMFEFIVSALSLQRAEFRVLSQRPLCKLNSTDVLRIDSDDTVIQIEGRKENICTVRVPTGVTKIGARAFYLCNRLKKVTLPGTIETIADCAFRLCISLKCVTIAPGVKKIGDKAFDGNLSVQPILVSESVAVLGASVFRLCISLTYVSLPKFLTSIPDSAFRYCVNLSRVAIPASVTNIGKDSFAHCVSLSKVLLPHGVKSIGDRAFQACVKMCKLELPHSSGQEKVVIEKNAFFECRNLKVVYRPSCSPSFVVWALGQSKHRDNWQTTGIKRIRNILAIITFYTIERESFQFNSHCPIDPVSFLPTFPPRSFA